MPSHAFDYGEDKCACGETLSLVGRIKALRVPTFSRFVVVQRLYQMIIYIYITGLPTPHCHMSRYEHNIEKAMPINLALARFNQSISGLYKLLNACCNEEKMDMSNKNFEMVLKYAKQEQIWPRCSGITPLSIMVNVKAFSALIRTLGSVHTRRM